MNASTRGRSSMKVPPLESLISPSIEFGPWPEGARPCLARMVGASTNDYGRGMGVCAVEIRGCHKTAGAVLHARAQRDAPEGPRTGCVRFNPLFPRPWHLILVEYDRHIEAGAEDARAGEAGAPEGRGFELVGRSPRQSTALPSENGPTLMSALGAVNGSSLRQDASGNNVAK